MTLDTFTNTAGTALPTHGSWSAQSGTWVIAASGAACGLNSGSLNNEVCVRWTGNPGVGAAQCTKVKIVSGTSLNWMGPGVRHVAGQHTRYGCYANPGNGQIEINKVVQGAFTTLASVGSVSFANGDEIELEIDGANRLTAYLNGVPITGLIGIEDPDQDIADGQQGMIGFAFDTAALIDEFDDLAVAASGALPPKRSVRPVAPPPPAAAGRTSKRDAAPAPAAAGFVVERRRSRSEPPWPRLAGRSQQRGAPPAPQPGGFNVEIRRSRGTPPLPALRGKTCARGPAPSPAPAGFAVQPRQTRTKTPPLTGRTVSRGAAPAPQPGGYVVEPRRARSAPPAAVFGGRTTRRDRARVHVQTVPGFATSRWDTPSGLWFGAGGQTTLSVDLKASPDTNEGTLVGVTFHVSVNGVPVANVPTTETNRIGNFTQQDSPLPGVASGMAPLFCCGFDLDLEALAGGTVEVSATIRTTLAGVNYDTDVDAIAVYNDTDGVDRRPCTGTRYVSPAGDDGNNGLGTGSPMLRLGAAVNSLVAEFGANLRGGRIVVMTGANEIGGDVAVSNWHTGEGWLDIEFQSGATIARTLDGSGGTVVPNSYFRCTGNGGGTHCRVRWIGARVVGDSIIGLISTDVLATFWVDGGESGSHWNDGSNLLAKFRDDGGEPVSWDGSVAGGRYVATCHARRGCENGFIGASYLRDCTVERWLGLAYYDTGLDGAGDASWRSGSLHVVNCYSEEQDYIHEDEESAVQGLIDYAGGTNFVVSAQSGGPHNGKLRLTCSSAPPFDIFAHAASLVGSTRVFLRLSGFTSGGNNGDFDVLEAGAGAGYMILDATPTPETGGASARILTGTTGGSGGSWYNEVHPDIWRVQGDKEGSIVQGLGTSPTVRHTQAMFSAGYTLTRCTFENVTMPSNCRNNFDGSDLIDCTFRFITVADAFDFVGATAPGSVFHDIVCLTTTGLGSLGEDVVDRVHVISGGAVGTNGTTGPWFEDYPAEAYLPAAAVRGNDSGRAARSELDKWLDDEGWSQGAGEFGPGSLLWGEDEPAEQVDRVGLYRRVASPAPVHALAGRSARRGAAPDAPVVEDGALVARRSLRSSAHPPALIGWARRSGAHAPDETPPEPIDIVLPWRTARGPVPSFALVGRAARRGAPHTGQDAPPTVLTPTTNLTGTRALQVAIVGRRTSAVGIEGRRTRNISIEGTTT